jgi:hypothetical protein
MDDGVRAAAEGHIDGDGVFKRALMTMERGLAVEPDVFDDLAARRGGDAGMGAIDRGMEEAPGMHEAERLGQGGEGGGGAHGHAVAGAAGDAVLDLAPLFPAQVAGAFFVPVFPDIAAGAERLAAPVALHHRAAGHVDDGDVHAEKRP